MELLIPLAILFGFFWFFVLLPQRRRQREHLHMQDSLEVGAAIVTAGGMHGTVTAVDEKTVLLEIAPGTIVRVDRRAVAARAEGDVVDVEPVDGDEATADSDG